MIKVQNKPYTEKEIRAILHPIVDKWFFSRFKKFTPGQLHGVLPIHSRENILISSPTGSGKTLTGFLSVLNELIDSSTKGILEDKVYCVYISPLKALSRDISVNLLAPLKEMEELSGKELGIRVGLRTGDTTPYERQKMAKKPPHILITTPESLSIMLASPKFREHFRKVQWCVVDEIHAIAENKRGVHLSLTLEQLSHLADHVTRVGLSATVAPIEEIAQYLVGVPGDCKIVDVQYIKQLDLQVVSPVADLINTSHEVKHVAMYKQMDKLIQQHKTTLIFTNTRAATERVVDHLKNKFPGRYSDNIGAHHSSLGKNVRFQVEENLRNGKLKVVVCSSSLELGIDIGYIDLVLCLGSPKSVARCLQRIGRSGHKLHEKAKGRIIVLDRDDLIECAVLVKSGLEKKIDRIHIPCNCLDVLAQQIIGISVQEVWEENALFESIKKSYCYRDLKREDFNEVLSFLAGEFSQLEDRHVYARIWRKDGKIGRRGKMARVLYMTNIGTIPDESFVTVKIGTEIIGYVEEAFLEKLKPGDVFILGGSTYQFKYSRGMVAQVMSTTSRPPTVPSWFSEMLPLSFDLGMEISKFRRLMEEKFKKGLSKKEMLDFLHDYLYIDEKGASAIYQYFSLQYHFCKHIPNDKKIVIEQYKTDDGELKIIFHTLFGRRVNDVLSRAVAYVIGKTQHKDVQMGISDTGFYVATKRSINAKVAFTALKGARMHELMNVVIDKTEVLKRRFRHCATRSLMILRNYRGRNKTVGKQHMSSHFLLSAVKRLSNNFSILKESRREVLEDLMDIDNAIRILNRVENSSIKIVEFETKLPSPFAFKLAFQGYMDVLRIEERSEFLRRMHAMVVAKVSLDKGKKNEKVEEFDYKNFWVEIEKEREAEKMTQEHELRGLVFNLKRVPRYAKAEIARMLDGHTDIRKDVLASIEKHKEDIKKDWPKKLQKAVFKKIKELG